MENQSHLCGFCTMPYDSNDHTPRILINCGHTLCSYCLNKIFKLPHKSRKCPLDNIAFSRSQNYLDKFPPNFALLALLEGKKQNTCQVHDKKLKIFCLQDKVKICSDCALFGEHKGHPAKKIKTLKANGVKMMKDLEERLKNPFEKSQDAEILKKRCLGKLSDRFGEIKKVLKDKHLEWRKQVENLFERNTENHNESLSKKEVEKVLEEIDQAIQKEENLAILDQDFSSILSRLQVTKGETSKTPDDETLRVMNCLESFLIDQEKRLKKTLEDFDLSSEKRKPVLIETKKKFMLFKSPFSVKIHKDFLSILAEDSNPTNQKIDLDALNKMKKINVEFKQYDSLFQDPNYLSSLSEILEKVNHYTSLMLEFKPSGLTDDRALNLLNILFPKIKQLTEIHIYFENSKITDEPISFFYNNILPKASSLKYINLKLGYTRITDKSLFALAKSLSHFSKDFKALRLGVPHTSITDEGIEKVFSVIEGVKELKLYLWDTQISDHSLKVLGNTVMPCMKNLKKFTLDVSKTRVTMEGVNAIFTGIPKDISELVLIFKEISLSDEVISLFEEKVGPKLELAEIVHLRFEGEDLEAKVSKVLKKIGKEGWKRGKSPGSNNRKK